MDLATITGIVGALGAAIATVQIIHGWLRRSVLRRREDTARAIWNFTTGERRDALRTLRNAVVHSRPSNNPTFLTAVDRDRVQELFSSVEARRVALELLGAAEHDHKYIGIEDQLDKLELARAFTSITGDFTVTTRLEDLHRGILNHLPLEERQFSEGFLEDGVEHLSLADEPVRPFIFKETRDTTFWILKIRLFKFAKSRRRQVS